MRSSIVKRLRTLPRPQSNPAAFELPQQITLAENLAPPAGGSVRNPTVSPEMSVTPLEPGWTEHKAPNGQFYYFNAATGVSTYNRPSANPSALKSKKKEKPRTKEPIPGTTWLKVTTTEDNVFYTNTETKTSSWTIPDEIATEVKAFEEAERERIKVEKEREEQAAREEAQRLLAQVRAEEEAKAAAASEAESRKRKAEEEAKAKGEMKPPEEVTGGDADAVPSKPKRQRTQKVSALEDLDEEWQKQIAEEMAREAETADGHAGAAAGQQPLQPATNLSSEEAKALFKAMLMEKDINPMAPWDNELPKFVADPRYTGVKVMKDRRDLFDEHCKHLIRHRRATKAATAKVDPAQAYRNLLIAAVTSTRTHWEDFRRDHKKDPAFRNFGRDEKEREKTFKGWLRELGERKRGEAKRAEELFEELLSERVGKEGVAAGRSWKDVRDGLKGEPRFDGIGSSSLREEIYNRWFKRVQEAAAAPNTAVSSEEKKAKEKQERQEASLKAREDQVRKERQTLERQAGKSRLELGREEGEREFRTLLIDAIRDHDASWPDVLPSLERDPRFHNNVLRPNAKRDLFQAHLSSLYSKRLAAAEAIFESTTPSLATKFSSVEDALTSESAVKRLNVPPRRLEELFESWQRQRRETAKQDFDAMLSESSFVEFWGRMRKAALEKEGGKAVRGIGTEGEEAEDEDEDGGVVDLREMAKNIDLGEVEAVLRNDKRWIVWDHAPEQREQWIRDYLENLAAPSLTVFQKSVTRP